MEIDDDIAKAQIRFYRADAASSPPLHLRVIIILPNGEEVDLPVTDFSLTTVQRGMLNNMLNALWQEGIAKANYT